MAQDFAIRIRDLGKCYQIYETPGDRLKQFIFPRLQRTAGQAPKQYFREFRALNAVSFDVRKGETVGIVGRNGSGKSTLLQIICGTLSPTTGAVETSGRIAALLELGSGFKPDFTGRENVYLNASVLGLSNDEIDARFDDIACDLVQVDDRHARRPNRELGLDLAHVGVGPAVIGEQDQHGYLPERLGQSLPGKQKSRPGPAFLSQDVAYSAATGSAASAARSTSST